MSLMQVEAGSEAFIRVRVLDQRVDPPTLFNPATDVRILLIRPDESIAVNYLTMTSAGTGIYTYAYQTVLADMAGIWQAQIKTTDGTSIVYRSAVAVFELLSTVPAGAVVTQGVNPASASATYIVQVPDSSLSAEQALSALATGYMKSALTTGIVTTQAIPIPATDGGTGLVTATLGDIIYASATNTWAKLAKDTNATRYLSNTGASNIPMYAQVNVANGVTGILPGANGGTGNAVGPIVTVPWGPFYGTAVGVGATVFLGRDDDATEINVLWRAPVACTLTVMRSYASVVAGAGQTFIYTLRVGEADSALTMTVTGTGGGGIAGTATGSIAVTAGQAVCIKLVTSAGAGVANHQVTLGAQVQN